MERPVLSVSNGQDYDCLVVYDSVIGIPYILEVHKKTFPLVTVLISENRFVYHAKKQRWEKNRKPDHANLFEGKIERRVTEQAQRKNK